MGLYAIPCTRASKSNQQKCISPAPGCSSKLTHTGVAVDTCAIQTGCQLFSAASSMSLGLCLLTQFQRHEAILLDTWLLAVLRQCGGYEFNPRRFHDNQSFPLWVYMRLPVPDGLSVVYCSLGNVIGIVFIDAISVAWSSHAGKLVVLPKSGGREMNHCRIHDNLSVPLVGLYAIPCARASKLNQEKCISPAPERSSN